MRFGFISTFPPTMCGLASYTDSLARHIAELDLPTPHVVRAREDGATLAAPTVQAHAIIVGDLVTGRTEDHWLLNSQFAQCDVVVIQHEFGIFGGEDGDDVLSVMHALELPTIVVLHTVLAGPTPNQLRIVNEIGARAGSLVVMTDSAFTNLAGAYDVDMGKVSVIPHGVPVKTDPTRIPLTTVPGSILTWGLIGPGKGIEWGIMALSLVKDQFPDACYRVVGQTHPKVFERDGNDYLEMLQRLAVELGVSDRVFFENEYLPLEELWNRIDQAEIVLLPYDARNQVTSGVLVEALAAGKPVVATAFPHALELINDSNGIVVRHESPVDVAHALAVVMVRQAEGLLTHPTESMLAVDHSWPTVAQKYYDLALTQVMAPVLK